MICSSTNCRTISVMAFCSSVFSENCGVASAMRCRTSRASGGRGGYRRSGLLLGLAGRDTRGRAVVPAHPRVLRLVLLARVLLRRGGSGGSGGWRRRRGGLGRLGGG